MISRIRIRMSFDYGQEREVVIEKDWLDAILFLNRMEQDSDIDSRRVTTIEIVDRAIKDVSVVLRKLVAEKLDDLARGEEKDSEGEDVPIE